MFDFFVPEIGDSLAAYVGHGHTYCQREDKCTDNQNLTVLIFCCIVHVGVYRMMIHCQKCEEIIITLEDCFRKRVIDCRTNLEVFIIQPKFTLFHFH